MSRFIIQVTPRLYELLADGYLVRDDQQPNMVTISPKGMHFLLAEAPRPITKDKLVKDTKPMELNDCLTRSLRGFYDGNR
jgi:hypothetical protein